MFGPTELQNWVIGSAALVGSLTDLRDRKIYNWLTFPMILFGIAFSILLPTSPQSGLGAVLGIAIAFGALLPLYLIRGVGAGDVKFLMGFGAWMGWRATLEVTCLTFLLGAVYGLADLLRKKKALGFAKRIFVFFRALFIKELEIEPLRIDHSEKIPLGVAVAVAAVWTQVSHPVLHFWETLK